VRFGFGVFMSKKSHHGENSHRMEQVPERPALSNSPDLLMASKGNIPPAEMKRLTHKTAKRQAKKTKDEAQK
jgi:hypothetical protein